jgi:cytochrome c peroxidase
VTSSASNKLMSAVAVAAVTLISLVGVNRAWPSGWTPEQEALISSLNLVSAAAPPPDISNRFADLPGAAALGAKIFSDPAFSKNGKVACSTCHQPGRAFTDGSTVAQGMGVTTRNTPSVVTASYAALLFWDGRRDSVWAQALLPLEGTSEHGATRAGIVHVLHQRYRGEYEALFGPLPSLEPSRTPLAASPLGDPTERAAWERLAPQDQHAINSVFAKVGKALAAYQRGLAFEPARFDRYARELAKGNHLLARLWMTDEELSGLRLFIGRANCVLCHSGPFFTNHEFFALGLPFGVAGPDHGRAAAYQAVRGDPFNCAGRYSDAPREACKELLYMANDALGFLANFKVPSLRNVTSTAPYMHAGQLQTLEQVLDHYNRAPRVPFPEHTDIRPLGLTSAEQAQIIAFLGTLSSEIRDPHALRPR